MEHLLKDVKSELDKIPLLDIHTHMDGSHLSARGLHDVMLYHMLITELYSAGCPDGSRLSECPDENEAVYRIERALPYLKYIENTSCFWGMRIILRDLYDWDEPVTKDNWQTIHNIIKKKYNEKNWATDIMKKANVKRINTELWRGNGRDDVFQYGLEWAFFTRAQWGQFDTALLELEYAWNQETPGAPLPVTTDRTKLNFTKSVKSITDIDDAINHYCSKIPYDKLLCTASHISTDINFREVTDAEMAQAIKNRANAGPFERDIYANYIFNKYLKEMSARNCPLTLQFSVGAEPLPFETGSKLRTGTIFEMASIFAKYPNLKFSLFLSNAPANQAICTVIREIPNISVSAYWWHNFFPSIMEGIMDERLDMLPTNRQFAFFSDAYSMDWLYAKWRLVRECLANVFAKRIVSGQYKPEQAVRIMEMILNTSPRELLGMTY